AWHDETQWITVLNGQRLAVHGVGEEHVAVARVIEPKTALETHGFRAALHGSTVGAAEQHVLRIGPHASAIQEFDERHTGPLRSADSAQPPFLTFGGAIEQRTSVAGTLQGGHQRFRSHVLEIANRETLRPLDEAADGET